MSKRKVSGFTLIELLVTIAIIGILSAVAMPVYSDYVRRGKVPEATTALASMRVQMEQYYQDNRNYGDAPPACGVATPTSTNFTYACVLANTAQTYTITASGSSARGTDNMTYTINQAGTRGSTAWGETSTTCWITKKGGIC